MKSLPLEGVHGLLGARFGEVAGWRIPLDYGDSAAEQRAVRSAVGVVDWGARGKIRITGSEALPFLDNLLTNDLEPLVDGQGQYAALLEHRGHVVGDLAVFRNGDDFLLETDAEVAETVRTTLERHLVSDDAVIEDVTFRFALFGLFGPASERLVRASVGTPPALPYEHHAATIGGVGLRIARSSYFGGEGYELWVPSSEDAANVWRELVRAGGVPFGHMAAEALRIEAGRPKSRVDMDEHTLAIEARLEPAISMTKGCFLGQEVVARIVNQGHVNRLLVGLELEGERLPSPHAPIAAGGVPIGTVTSAARSEALGRVVALGLVKRTHAEPGTLVTIEDRPGRVAALPFLRA